MRRAWMRSYKDITRIFVHDLVEDTVERVIG